MSKDGKGMGPSKLRSNILRCGVTIKAGLVTKPVMIKVEVVVELMNK